MDEIIIGNNVMVGPEVMLLTGRHGFSEPSKLLREQLILTAPIIIGNDCWVGVRVVILPRVSIADRVVIAAGSVVAKSIETSGVYAGVPVRKIKDIPV